MRLADGALLSNQFLGDKQVRFEGPGFGNPNGGVWLGGCSVADGDYPPLSNASVNGNGFMGFSTLHTLSGRVGKPVGPETIRFDAYMTNVARLRRARRPPRRDRGVLGAADSYDDLGELLLKESVPLSDGLVRHELVDSQNIFVDCVRRLVISLDRQDLPARRLGVRAERDRLRHPRRRGRRRQGGGRRRGRRDRGAGAERRGRRAAGERAGGEFCGGGGGAGGGEARGGRR